MKTNRILQRFQEKTPKRSYHSDNLELYGLRVSFSARALKSRHIQANSHSHKWWLVFDIDSSTAGLDWYDQNAPTPNIVITNNLNGHAHIVYGLETSIRTAEDAREKPLKYAAAIERALRDKLEADHGYSGLIMKNPLHEHWRVTVWEGDLYTLDHLADYLDLNKPDLRKPSEYGLGRNCILFDDLRAWAYKAIRQGWPEYNQWLRACNDRVQALNLNFKNPLPAKEASHIAKSVAKWTYKNFNAAEFSRIQSKRGKLSKGGGRPSRKAELLPVVLEMKSKGYTQQDIADDLKIPRQTISRWLKN
jgi:hypothetical protein